MSGHVAVTGIGVVSALGVGVQPFWDALLAGRGTPGGRIEHLEVRRWVRSAQGRRIDRTSLLALAAARLALADAGLAPEALEPPRTALALGSAFGNIQETVTFLDRIFERGTGNPLLFPNLVMNAALSYVAIELGITGPSAMVTEQDASGEAAIGWGAKQVADGAVEVCLAGAADELAAGVVDLGRAGHAPVGDGARPAEGAAVLVLESPAHALRRGARRYARLVPHAGFGIPAPVHGWSAGAGQLAQRLAPLAGDVDLVVAAASGDVGLDELEAEALARVFAGRRVAVTAPRGTTGSFGAAGALAVAAAALSASCGLVPPTIGWSAGMARGLDVVTGAARAMPVHRVLVDGLARGGACRPLRLEAAG